MLLSEPSSWPFVHETACREKGFLRVAGVDEAGRGPLAGPVVAAAVVFPDASCPAGVADSKCLSPAQRDAAYDVLVRTVAWSVGIASVEEIDAWNILRATHLAMRQAIQGLDPCCDFVLVDGLPVPDLPCPSHNLVRGEHRSASIAAASIIAKVTRDRLMADMHALYPSYGFDRHKGYGTPQHLRALFENGPCPCHRQSFAPVRNAVSCGETESSSPQRREFDLGEA